MRPRLEATRSTVIALMTAVGALAPHWAAADPASPKSAAECRAISDFNLRGQCWDALDRKGLHDEQVQRKQNFGLTAPPPAPAAPKAKKAAHAKRAKPESDGVNSLTLTIATVGATPLGRIQLTATDGAVWEQTDSDTVDRLPSPGDTLQISKGQLGGYMCQVTHFQSVRCRRDQ
jgi:hypothetical protein